MRLARIASRICQLLGELSHFRRHLLRWYDTSRRDLPWRVSPAASRDARPDPYYVLLSETMLQQTQVATVIPYFQRFIGRFPTIGDLAAAHEQEVLRFWQGLGYYTRARNLHRCARTIVSDHAGQVPQHVESLLQLPGIGRYTAGAIASLAFNRPAPILDGNVTRVLCRLDAITDDPRDRTAQRRLWHRAAQILPKSRVGDFNSALMELGATVCTPRNPQCLICPVTAHCQALAAAIQDRVPAPKRAVPTPLLERLVLCLRHGDRYLIEQRPPNGRWASMWQFKTLEAPPKTTKISPSQVRQWVGLDTSVPIHLCIVNHSLTHRRYRFDTYVAEVLDPVRAPGGRRTRATLPPSATGRSIETGTWVKLERLVDYPFPKPHVEIAKALATMPCRSGGCSLGTDAQKVEAQNH